jgi:hypothetical protein
MLSDEQVAYKEVVEAELNRFFETRERLHSRKRVAR